MSRVLGMHGRVSIDNQSLCSSMPPACCGYTAQGIIGMTRRVHAMGRERMATRAIPTVSEARATANAWLMTHLPDRFAAGIPDYDATQGGWRIPVWLSYPKLEPLGPVGELLVDAVSGDVHVHTSIADMKSCALQLYEQHRAQIETPLL
jgi:hypothetical protein